MCTGSCLAPAIPWHTFFANFDSYRFLIKKIRHYHLLNFLQMLWTRREEKLGFQIERRKNRRIGPEVLKDLTYLDLADDNALYYQVNPDLL